MSTKRKILLSLTWGSLIAISVAIFVLILVNGGSWWLALVAALGAMLFIALEISQFSAINQWDGTWFRDK